MLAQAYTDILCRQEQAFAHNMWECLFMSSYYNYYLREYTRLRTYTRSHTINVQMYTANVLLIGAQNKMRNNLNVGFVASLHLF